MRFRILKKKIKYIPCRPALTEQTEDHVTAESKPAFCVLGLQHLCCHDCIWPAGGGKH